MILAIDVGNTNTVIGCIDNGEILNIARIQTAVKATSMEYAIKLKQILDLYNIDKSRFSGAIISSVVPQVTVSLQSAIRKLTGLESMVVRPGMKTGMDFRVDDPSTVAGDLVTGCVAAIGCYSVPSIVIDMGTATTLFVVDKNRCFRGGAILPGLKLSYAALSSGTSLLPSISFSDDTACIGTNTVDCMRSGALYGSAAMLDGMIERIEAELGEKCTVVATGGLARYIIKYCKRDDIIFDDDLLLKGLWILYQKNS